MHFSFITPDDPRYPHELELRFRVLREPLGHAREDVPFPFERESLHLLAWEHDALLGCVLFHPESAAGGRLFQMAITPARQGQGLGRALVQTLESELQRRGLRQVHLHARELVVPFWQRLGYALVGDPFVEVGVPHRHMRRTLPPARPDESRR